ncbi:hypothetical protein [Leptolyngbya sp. Cla-17]|uniref:hypothetical protein n=1 Tax=Leptolyngbya sp. Cla-17 TaxID=2803751 RepID=UPI0018D80299|nr:hypothetical protein [Leptolyngbya sp. Cla-17]
MKTKPIKKPFFPVALSLVAAIATCSTAIAAETPSVELSADQNPVTMAQVPIDVASAETTADSPVDVASTMPVEVSSAVPVEVASNMPVAAQVAESQTVAESQAATEPQTVAVKEVAVTGAESSGALNFNPPSAEAIAAKEQEPTTAQIADAPTPIVETAPSQVAPDPQGVTEKAAVSPSGEKLFEGGSESLVARTVGAAEGTRAADGGKTSLYEGHIDPGNGVWNRGTFSYQFGNEENLTADEADRRQLAKIQRIHESVMLPKAAEKGIAPLTLAEEINGIDLINQAPLAVTEEGGYVERLAEAKKKGLSGDEAILDARVWAFWDAGKGGWDAPGLRAYDDMGKEASIRHDQDRRMGMIDQALEAYQQQHGEIAQSIPSADSTKLSQNAIAGVPPSSNSNLLALVRLLASQDLSR